MMSGNRELNDDCRKQAATDAAQNVSSAISVDDLRRLAFHLAPHLHEYLGNAVFVLDGEHGLGVKLGDSCW